MLSQIDRGTPPALPTTDANQHRTIFCKKVIGNNEESIK